MPPSIAPSLADLAYALMADPGSARHARVATALLIQPELKGKRAIALASGLHERTVEDLVPWTEGEQVGFLVCTQTGTEGPLSDEPRKTGWQVVQCNRTLLPQGLLPTSVEVLQGEVVGDPQGLARARMTGAITSGCTGGTSAGWGLDPKLDCWAEGRAGVGGVGTTGWALTLLALAGLVGRPGDSDREIQVGLRESAEVLGMTERRARDLLARMEDAKLGWRVRGGFVLIPEMLDEGAQGQDRADRRRARHEREVRAYHDPLTKFARRDFLVITREYQPDLADAEREALWQEELVFRARRSEMQVEAFEELWAEMDAADAPAPVEEPAVEVPDPDAARRWGEQAAILRDIRPGPIRATIARIQPRDPRGKTRCTTTTPNDSAGPRPADPGTARSATECPPQRSPGWSPWARSCPTSREAPPPRCPPGSSGG